MLRSLLDEQGAKPPPSGRWGGGHYTGALLCVTWKRLILWGGVPPKGVPRIRVLGKKHVEKPSPVTAATKKGKLSDKLSKKVFKEDKRNTRSLDSRNVRLDLCTSPSQLCCL